MFVELRVVGAQSMQAWAGLGLTCVYGAGLHCPVVSARPQHRGRNDVTNTRGKNFILHIVVIFRFLAHLFCLPHLHQPFMVSRDPSARVHDVRSTSTPGHGFHPHVNIFDIII
jgi:hypothetical protein